MENEKNMGNEQETGIPEKEDKMNLKAEVIELIKMIIMVVLIVYIVDEVVLINAKIPSASMENTIMTKDRIFGFRMAYGINLDFFNKDVWTVKMKDPERYDIIIFRYPDDESSLFIKRLIGLPGETVEIIDGDVYVTKTDGERILLDDSFLREPMRGSFGPYEVPENCYFMLGDNRNNSKDSRFWHNTYVTFDQIVGKALFRYFWPPKLLTYHGQK